MPLRRLLCHSVKRGHELSAHFPWSYKRVSPCSRAHCPASQLISYNVTASFRRPTHLASWMAGEPLLRPFISPSVFFPLPASVDTVETDMTSRCPARSRVQTPPPARTRSRDRYNGLCTCTLAATYPLGRASSPRLPMRGAEETGLGRPASRSCRLCAIPTTFGGTRISSIMRCGTCWSTSRDGALGAWITEDLGRRRLSEC